MRNQKIMLTLLLLVTVLHGVAFSQIRGYPNRQIEMVVPTKPGGGVDINTRVLTEELSKVLGVPIIVLNKFAGFGAAGAEYVLNAKPDGYTLLASPNSLLIPLPATMPEVSFRWTSFVPIIQFAHQPYVFLTRADSPYNTATELAAFAKKNPGKLNAAGSGAGSSTHALFETWREAVDVDMGFIPYKGSTEMVPGLLGGHIDIYVGSIGPTKGLLKAGKLKVVATVAKLKEYPQIPTFSELGFPEIISQFNITIVAHGKTPKEIVDKLEKAMEKALQTPTVIKKLDDLDFGTVPLKGKDLVNALEIESKAFNKIADKMRKALTEGK